MSGRARRAIKRPKPHIRFGRYLQQLRKKHRIGQKHLKDALHCSLMAVSNWETGVFLPDPRNFPRLVRALRLDGAEKAALVAHYEQEKREQALGEQFSRELGPAIRRSLEEASEPPQCPLYGSRSALDPREALSKPEKWRGRYITIPDELRGRKVFAYKVTQAAPGAALVSGDIVFCDIEAGLAVERHALARFGGQILYGEMKLVKGRPLFVPLSGNTSTLPKQVRPVKWCYRAIAVVRNLEGTR